MQRRNFIKLSSLLAVSSLYATEKNTISLKTQFSEALVIPPIAPYKIQNGKKVFNLNVQKGKMAFVNGALTNTYGINGDFLGPTIRVQNKDKVLVHVKNSLDEITTLHWHGLKVKGNSDGGPHSVIHGGKTWSADIDINQRSCTAWYHPHTMHKTGEQVFKGIAGLFIIDDEDSHKLDLPKEYGVDDIPLVIQDRRFGNDGQFIYKQSMHDTMMGVTGNVHLINGVSDPYLEVPAKAVRFRILNGANARIYNLMFANGEEFHQIAGDSSFLPTPVKLQNFVLSPGERAEIVVDFSKYSGQTLIFGDAINKRALMKVIVKETKTAPYQLPQKLATIDEYKDAKVSNKRSFTLDMAMGWLGINKKQMNMNRIDETIKKDDFEIWEIINNSPRPHPFHIHGTTFQIISRDGKAPLKNELGLKDTILLYAQERAQIIVTFNHKADKNRPYMYHCHILEHEDAGMMGQFVVKS